MDLSTLSDDELRDEFLKVNQEYNRAISSHGIDYILEPSFKEIRERLHAVLDELKERRKYRLN